MAMTDIIAWDSKNQEPLAIGEYRSKSLPNRFRRNTAAHLARASTAAAVILSLSSAVRAQTNFTFTTIDVPFPGAFQPTPTGINDKGLIVGYYLTYGLVSHGFTLSNGTYYTFDFPAHDCTDFHAVNNQDQIVGYGCNDGFLFVDGQFSTIRIPGIALTSPNGINNAGDIVGDHPSCCTMALFHSSLTPIGLWESTTMVRLSGFSWNRPVSTAFC